MTVEKKLIILALYACVCYAGVDRSGSECKVPFKNCIQNFQNQVDAYSEATDIREFSWEPARNMIQNGTESLELLCDSITEFKNCSDTITSCTSEQKFVSLGFSKVEAQKRKEDFEILAKVCGQKDFHSNLDCMTKVVKTHMGAIAKCNSDFNKATKNLPQRKVDCALVQKLILCMSGPAQMKCGEKEGRGICEQQIRAIGSAFPHCQKLQCPV